MRLASLPENRLADARRKAGYRLHIHGAAGSASRHFGAKRSAGTRRAQTASRESRLGEKANCGATYSAPASAPAPATPAVGSTQAAPPPAPPAPVAPPPPSPPQPITVTIPESTIVTVRTTDAIDFATSSAGQTFRGSLDAPIVVDDRVVVPKGLNVTLKLVNASAAGKFKGSSELTVSLDSFTYQGRTYTLSTSDVQEKGASRGKRSAAVIGGGTALGALIGGLAGGGKGAAIGAGVGAGGGAAVQAMTKGQQVKIPSETRLEFTLHAPVAVTYVPHQKTSRVAAINTDSSQPANPSTPQ